MPASMGIRLLQFLGGVLFDRRNIFSLRIWLNFLNSRYIVDLGALLLRLRCGSIAVVLGDSAWHIETIIFEMTGKSLRRNSLFPRILSFAMIPLDL